METDTKTINEKLAKLEKDVAQIKEMIISQQEDKELDEDGPRAAGGHVLGQRQPPNEEDNGPTDAAVAVASVEGEQMRQREVECESCCEFARCHARTAGERRGRGRQQDRGG